jgi:hypothetical protein
MADKTLKDVVDSLKTVDNTLKEPVKKSSSDVEREQETARDAKASKEIQQDILATLKAGVGGAAQADKKQGGLIAGLLGGIGAGIGSIGKAVSKIGPKFIVGMGSIALGIGAFMLGLGGAGKIAELAGFDGKALKSLVENTIGAFSGTDLVAMGAVIAAAMLLEKSKTTKAGVVLGMGAIGAGISVFLLALGGAGKIAELSGFDGKALNALVKNVFGAFGGTDLVVMASIIAAAVGLEKTKTTKAGVILGMGAIGAGIGAFLLALGGAGKIGELAGFDGKALNALVKNTFGAFSGTDMVVMGAIIGAAMGIDKAKVSKVGVVLGMGAIGGGIAAFTLGILAAEGFSSLGALIGLDGKSLKKLIGNFFEAFETVGISGLVTLLTAGALAGAIPGGAIAVVKGMTAIGAGIAGFSIGLLAAEGFATLGKMLGLDGSALKVLLSNVGEGIGGFIGGIGKGVFEQLQDLDADKLVQLGKGIAGIGIGIAAFGAGTAIGVVGGVVGALGSFFGVKSPIDTIIELSKDKDIDAKRLAELGGALEPLGKGLAAFSGFSMSGGMIGDSDLESFIKVIAKIGDSDVVIDKTKMEALAAGLTPLGTAISGFANVDIAKIVDTSTFGKSTLEIFFLLLASDKLKALATATEMQAVADGITPLGKAMDTFSGLDMASIVGNNWTPGKETSFESFIGALGTATEKIKNPTHLQNVAIGVRALGEAMQTFAGIDAEAISTAMRSTVMDVPSTEGVRKTTTRKKYVNGKLVVDEIDGVSQLKGAATGGLITQKSAGIFELHQGEMVMDNASVAAFRKSLDLMNMSQANALAGVGGAAPIIVNNNNNVDNSMRSSQSTSVSVPEATRTNESTLRALQMS